MGVRLPTASSTVLQNGALNGNTEFIVLTTPPMNISLDFQQVLISAYINVTPGASTTGITGRIRRGTTAAGQLVSLANTLTVVAGSSYQFMMCYIDTPGAVAGIQYTFTAQTIAQTVQAIVNDGCIIVMAL